MTRKQAQRQVTQRRHRTALQHLAMLPDGFILLLRRLGYRAYAVAYLLAIPYFAIVYQVHYDEFYCSTVMREPESAQAAQASARTLELYIYEGIWSHELSAGREGPYVLADRGIHVDPDSFIAGQDELNMVVVVTVIESSSPEAHSGRTQEHQYRTRVTLPFAPGPRQSLSHLSREYLRIDDWSGCPIAPERIFVPMRGVLAKRPMIELPNQELRGLHDYWHLLQGRRDSEYSAMASMFYLSTVTITTLGYGDIVPLTTRARLLVSLEAISGVVLVGLFLNGLAKSPPPKRRRTPSPGPDTTSHQPDSL